MGTGGRRNFRVVREAIGHRVVKPYDVARVAVPLRIGSACGAIPIRSSEFGQCQIGLDRYRVFT